MSAAARNLVEVTYTPDGKPYAYDAGNLQLSVGDEVLVARGKTAKESVATVVKVGSEYKGYAKQIVRVFSRASERGEQESVQPAEPEPGGVDTRTSRDAGSRPEPRREIVKETLLDRFAMAALPGVMATLEADQKIYEQAVAADAYAIARAMLVERYKEENR